MAEAAAKLPEEVSITMVPPEAVLGLRKPITEHLERAIKEDVTPIEGPDDVIDQAIDGRTQIWLVHEGNDILGVVTTVGYQHPRFKVLRIIYLAGKSLEGWMSRLSGELENFARSQECAGLEGYALRRGWGKHAKALGAAPVGTLYRKSLED